MFAKQIQYIITMTPIKEKAHSQVSSFGLQRFRCQVARDRLEIAPNAFSFVVFSSVRVRRGRR